MIPVCEWCNTRLGTTSGGPQTAGVSAHLICKGCLDNFVFQMGVPLQSLLERLAAPVFVVDGDGVVKTANSAAYATVGKPPDKVEGERGGVVFECAYARLPGGCGKTLHCSGCTVRRTVMETFATGVSRELVPATLRVGDPVEPDAIAMLISTEKMGDVVLLRIDELGGQAAQKKEN